MNIIKVADGYEITEDGARRLGISFDDCVYNSTTGRACISDSVLAECSSLLTRTEQITLLQARR